MSGETREVLQTIHGHAFEEFKTVGGPIEECVMPLLAKVDGLLWPVGTAFAIHSAGLMVTARHVVEEAASHAVPRHGADGSSYMHYELIALYLSAQLGGGESELLGGLLPVVEVWSDEQQDVAILRVDLPRNTDTGESLRLRTVRLGVRPPKQGNPVVAYGYYKMAASRVVDGDVTYKQSTAISSGRVIDLFHEKRDSLLATYPSFHVDARFAPGMSGGPIIDDRDRVCGIVSRGVTSEDDVHTGLGASIWPVLALPIRLNVDGSGLRDTTLLELARRKILPLDEDGATIDVSEGVVRIHYKADEEWRARDAG
jgi:S1-C subfamily serine protease